MFEHFTKRHFLHIFHRNLLLLKSSYRWIIFAILMQLWHNIATNIAYYIHIRQDLLWDLGFEVLPENESLEFLNEILFGIASFLGFILTLSPSFMSQEHTNHITSMVMILRLCKVYGFVIILRTFSFLSTSLPSPSHHCRIGSTTYDPPNNVSQIIFRIDPTTGCGDLVFSGHTSTVLTIALTASHYSYYLFPKFWKYIAFAIYLPITLILSALIIIAQNHYTVDIVVALYTVPLLYYFLWHTLPDPACRTKTRQDEEGIIGNNDINTNDAVQDLQAITLQSD
eukprot:985483_1